MSVAELTRAFALCGLLVRPRCRPCRPPPPTVVYVVQSPVVQVAPWMPLPLGAVHVQANIFDFCAEVTVTQTYTNPTSIVLDSEYVFPCDENSAVSAFNAEVGDRIIHGLVKEKAQAKAEFLQARAAGKTAALLEQKSENIFKASIGNIPAGATIKISLKYITTLDLVGRANTFVIPAIVAPKYEPHVYYGWNGHRIGGPQSSDPYGVHNYFGYPQPQPQVVITQQNQIGFFQAMTAQYMGTPAAASVPTITEVAPGALVASVSQPAALPPQRFSMQIELMMPSQIVSITSESHASQLVIAIDAPSAEAAANPGAKLTVPHHASVRFGMDNMEGGWPESLGTKDFTMQINQAAYLETRAVLEVDPATGSQAIQLAFCPQSLDMLDASALRTEVLFLVDQSGSMGGSGIEAVKQVLQLFLRSLPVHAKLNIISFGSTYRKLFPHSMPYSEQSINQALNYAANIKADLGGTEIFAPLEHCFTSPHSYDYPRQIFLLTDGQVTNTQQLVELTRANSYHSRLFAFGLGSSVDRVLVKSLAQAGRGQCEFVGSLATAEAKQELSSKVMRQLIRAMQPSLNNVKVDWSAVRTGGGLMGLFGAGQAVQQCPETIAPIFAPARELIYALNVTAPLPSLAEAGQPDKIVNLRVTASSNRPRGDVVEGKCVWDIPINLSRVQQGTFIHKLAARARIGELQDMRAGDLKFSALGGQQNAVLALALKYQLLSNYTSFVLVDDRRVAARRDPNRVRKSAGWRAQPQVVPVINPMLANAQVNMLNAFMQSQMGPGVSVNANGYAVQPVAAAAQPQPGAAVGPQPAADVQMAQAQAAAPPAAAAAAAVVDARQPVVIEGGWSDSDDDGEYEAQMIAADDEDFAAAANGPSSSSSSSYRSSRGGGGDSRGGRGGGRGGILGAVSGGGAGYGGASFSFGSSNGYNGDRGAAASASYSFGAAPAAPQSRCKASAASPLTSLRKSAAKPQSQVESQLESRLQSRSRRLESNRDRSRSRDRDSIPSNVVLCPPEVVIDPAQMQQWSNEASFASLDSDEDSMADDCFAPQAAAADEKKKRKAAKPTSASAAAAPAGPAGSMSVGTAFTVLVQMCCVDGGWNLTPELLQLVQSIARLTNQSAGIQSALSSLSVSSLTSLGSTLHLSPKAIATLIALWCFRACFPDRSGEWMMIEGKAKGCLRNSHKVQVDDMPALTAQIIAVA